jgi:ribonuclease E
LPARDEVRKPAELKPAPNTARTELARPVRNEVKPENQREKATPKTAPANAGARGRPESKPSVVLPRETRATPEPTLQRQPAPAKSETRGANELKRSETPARSEVAEKPAGNARQRELERGKLKPEPAQPATGRRPATPPASKQVEKPATPAKEKPVVRKRGEAKKKPEDQKTEQETPQPATPPRHSQ